MRHKTEGAEARDDGAATGRPQAEGYLPASPEKKADAAAGKKTAKKGWKEIVPESEISWSASDLERIAGEGLTAGELDRELALFRRGVSPVRLNRPCREGDGIEVLTQSEQERLVEVCDAALRTKRFIKFVPASGAASRMFKEWYRALQEGGFPEPAEEEAFCRDLRRYSFFSDLQALAAAQGRDLEGLLQKKDHATLLNLILTEAGMNYGGLPKALLKFHAYPEGSRTPLEEHLVEADLYARDEQKVARLHVTVSSEHERAVRDHLQQVIGKHESRLGTVFEVGLSVQSKATNTLAVDLEYRPFRDDAGGLVFRPGGHGSLLANLGALDADIVFLKNIDNCVPDRLKPQTVRWKKILAGYLIALQEGIFQRLRLVSDGDPGERALDEVADFCRKELQLVLPPGFPERSPAERRTFLREKLNRPLRVCGMVKNEGEPGGGPFWVDSASGEDAPSLQIAEQSQIDGNDPGQRTIWESSTYFNPVDLVCGIRDYEGKKFALTRFVEQDWSTIAPKSEQGRDLLALERPGLWNGAMAYWNTVFVEVPLATFNPVKTVQDLLRPQHLPSS